MSEPHVITSLCRDCVDGACVDACPVECIYEARDPALPNQLFIHPEDCIHCGACEPACPWEAIHPEDRVQPARAADIALNRLTDEQPERFHVAESRLRKGSPTPTAVRENEEKWGLSA